MSWRTNGTRIEDQDGRLVAYLTPWSTEADARKIAAVDDMLTALQECAELLDDYSDVDDGEDGRPVPNKAMAMITYINGIIAQAEGK